MKNRLLLLVALLVCSPILSNACTMYKITKNGKTIVGNNEDWLSPNSKFWYEQGGEGVYGVMYMGQLDGFAQGAINEAGLVFDGFANPYLPIENTAGKTQVPIGDAVKKIMQTMQTVKEVKAYLSTIDLSVLASSQVVFVDQSGAYLIVEGDALIIGDEQEKAFSNFYYSQIESEDEVEIESYQNGRQFLSASAKEASLSYCGKVMESFANTDVFGTQYSTIYDLNSLTVRVYLLHDYAQFVEIDLIQELKKENHETMIVDLFQKESPGKEFYQTYNNEANPTQFLEKLVDDAVEITEEELMAVGFNSIVNSIGYEWLNGKNNPKAAIQIFTYGTELMPNDANLFDSLGEAYYEYGDYDRAKSSYQKSLALNPDNKNAEELILRIEEQTEN